MKCIEAGQHPNADNLRLYKFESGAKIFTIIANIENVYDVGDCAEIVLPGSLTTDGIRIEADRVRGIISQGMALGKTDLPVGTDVTDKHCREEGPIRFRAWPKIGAVFNVRKDLKATDGLRSVSYRAKVKLDGTNAGVHIKTDGTVGAQSRSRLITPEQDNAGFARWVSEKDWSELAEKAKAIDADLIVYGEWAGPGIQKGTSVSQIKSRVFAVFAVQIEATNGSQVLYAPEQIETFITPKNDVYIIPWEDDPITLDLVNPDVLERQLEFINDMVARVEECDPWVKDNFGVEGIGEGVVMYPYDETGEISRTELSELMFKAKGEKHKVVNTKKPAQVNPELVKSVDEFVTLFVTETRLEQIASKVGGFDRKLTGSFIKEFNLDVQSESSAELEAANLVWKDVAKKISNAGSSWWMKKCQKL